MEHLCVLQLETALATLVTTWFTLARSKIYIIDHNPSWKENQRQQRESFWIRRSQTLHPEGITKKD
jgi:hypothetical protein